MRQASVLCSLVVLLTTAPAAAQQWSAEQQEVIDHIRVCWDSWVDAVRAEDAEIWVDGCRGEDSTFWVSTDGAPANVDTFRHNVTTQGRNVVATDPAWSDIRPVVVRIHGDVAIAHFYGYWYQGTGSHIERVIEDKRTAVFVKRDGQWHFLAEHTTPSPENADVYR